MTSADELKDLGNKYFRAARYNDALEAYTKAIKKNPGMSQYHTNRALVYIQTRNWDKVIKDCKRAIELDPNSLKGFYFWGKAAVQLACYDQAVVALTKAFDLAQSHQVYGDEITSLLRQARREKFRLEELERQKSENELEIYLKNLIDNDLEKKLAALTTDETPAKSGEELQAEAQCRKDQLHALFSQVEYQRDTREIPDYLCGKISLELLRDPVITPSGITYDRSDILKHLNQVGHFDPLSRRPLTENDLIPNLAMREVLDNFLSNNEWARYES